MKPLEELCCQNSACAMYGKRGAGNLTVCGRIGKNKSIRQLYCRVCKARFSERKGTLLYHAKLPPEKVLSIVKHAQEGCGVRPTGRLVGVSKDTANRYIWLAGAHAAALHDELVAFSPSDVRGAVRREVGVRVQERGTLPTRQPGRPVSGRQLGSRGVRSGTQTGRVGGAGKTDSQKRASSGGRLPSPHSRTAHAADNQ